MTTGPGRSLDPALGALKPVTGIELTTTPIKPGQTARDLLNDAELARAQGIARKIDPANATAVAMLGTETQARVSQFADNFLNEVRLRDSGTVGDDLRELEKVVQGTDPNGPVHGLRGTLLRAPFLGSLLFSIDGYFTSVRKRVDQIMARLDQHRDRLVRDNLMYEQMRASVIQNRHDLLVIAAAGEITLKEGRERLPAVEQCVQASNDPEKGLELQRIRDGLDRLDTRVTHLSEFAYAQLVAAPQLQIVMETNLRLVDTIGTQLTLLVPLWKQTLALRLGLQRQAAAQAASDATRLAAQRALEEAARTLHQGAVSAAQSSSQPILGTQTLESITQQLLATVADVRAAREEGQKAREELLTRLGEMTQRLTDSLSGAATGHSRAG